MKLDKSRYLLQSIYLKKRQDILSKLKNYLQFLQNVSKKELDDFTESSGIKLVDLSGWLAPLVNLGKRKTKSQFMQTELWCWCLSNYFLWGFFLLKATLENHSYIWILKIHLLKKKLQKCFTFGRKREKNTFGLT